MKLPANSVVRPYVRPLTVLDLDSVLGVENAAFSEPRDRATKEKLQYRLETCPELSLGLFHDTTFDSTGQAETLTSSAIEPGAAKGKTTILLGHIVSTMTSALESTDESMAIPQDWRSEIPPLSKLGHIKDGRTIALHSAAVLPAFQRQGLGRMLMLAYIKHMQDAKLADRIALIAHGDKITWYTRLGFENKGSSGATFGSGGWFDCVLSFRALDQEATGQECNA